jgi:superfamily II DNA or RNA helicase
MFSALANETRAKLWAHQASAADFAIGHLNQSRSACLIRMPTGTGKTGVIGCLTRLANTGTSLVLTPWANLRIQMIEALLTGFWKDVRLQPRGPKVIEMLPKALWATV